MISRQSLIVARWEFLRFFKWKQQLISYLLMLGVIAAVALWSFFTDESRQQYRIAVPAGFAIDNTEQFQFQRPSISVEAQLAQLQSDESWHAVLTTSQDGIVIHTQSGKKWLSQLEQVLQQHYRKQAALGMGLTDSQLAQLEQPVAINTQYLDQSYKGKDTPEKMIAIGALLLLFIGLTTAFGQVLVSITGEKQQRVTEQLYAILTPQQWMDGKVLGHSFSALKAMFTSALVMLLTFAVVSVFAEKSLDLAWLDISVVLWLVPFALLGVVLCASFMGAIAASIDDPNNSGKGAVMMITWLPMLFTYLVIDSPNGWGMTLLSYLPLTSFAAMPVKLAMVELAWWQPLLSLLLLLATVWWMRRVAGRVFLRGMQLYGKEPSWGEIVRWALSNKAD
ncbi:ABC transporter permease [Rheinheimera nanhaiensis]|uniref:ABC-type Na+ efflux pump, permease component n=1 Tax=Rheinheimera nanhaiensis E407-8 TaxID=562729 RepID=I1DXX2_9GAMM|nr:ABC transporter permease [Rheinheimera nanhaiensis]GAB58900.1 ABC-type Na+ efflux pump, permease component [Rheinheimera nanhaiensis E407-8]